MLRTLPWRALALGLLKELRHLKGMIRAGCHADPLRRRRFQLRPALITPMKAFELVRLVSASQAHDTATQFIRAANRRVHGGPALAELKGARDEHGASALEV